MRRSNLALLLIISAFLVLDYTQFENRLRDTDPTSSTIANIPQSNLLTYTDLEVSRSDIINKADTSTPQSETNDERTLQNPPAVIKIGALLYIAKFYYLCKVQDIRHTLSHFFMFTSLKYFWSLVLLVLIFLV